jgi:hypothetical protein
MKTKIAETVQQRNNAFPSLPAVVHILRLPLPSQRLLALPGGRLFRFSDTLRKETERDVRPEGADEPDGALLDGGKGQLR